MAALASAVVKEAGERLMPLEIDCAYALWDANAYAFERNELRRIQRDLARSELLGDRDLFEQIQAAQEEHAGPHVRRQLRLLHHTFQPHQVPEMLRKRIVEYEAVVDSVFSQHRAVLDGQEVSDNDLRRVLRTSRDVEERRAAWEAAKSVGDEVATDVREIVRLRNEAARRVGHRDWFALSVAGSELDEDQLFRTLEECDRVTAKPFARWKATLDARLADRYGCEVDELRPWHYDDPFFQDVPIEGGVDLDPYFVGRDLVELSTRTFDGLGLETRGLLKRSDLRPRENKCQHAFCIDIDRAGDVRVLANVTDNAYWMETMLHELGHGVHAEGVDRDELPWLLRDSHTVVSEAVAILFGRLHRDPAWLRAVGGVDDAEVDALAPRLASHAAAEALVFTRWVLVMTTFERELYRDPANEDLDALWWQLVNRFQLVTPPDDRAMPDWASKIHFAVAPVYYHSYLYGYLVASQLHDALVRNAGGFVDRPVAGRYLLDRVFRLGESMRWDHFVEEATGAPLGVAAFARDLDAAV